MINLLVVTFALLFSVATLNAQTQQMSVSIPFDFKVGTQPMPAGQYAIATDEGYRLTIRSVKTPDTVQVLSSSIGSKHPEREPARLVFRNVGNDHYLVQVWSPGLQDGRSIGAPKNVPSDINGGSGETTIDAAR
jgi:hypothetical protein